MQKSHRRKKMVDDENDQSSRVISLGRCLGNGKWPYATIKSPFYRLDGEQPVSQQPYKYSPDHRVVIIINTAAIAFQVYVKIDASRVNDDKPMLFSL